jgi:Tol biopolymer transport system component
MGTQLEIFGKPAVYGNFDLSQDGKRLAVDITRRTGPTDDRDIWLMDLANGVNEHLTKTGTNSNMPVLSPDGQVVFIAGGTGGDIHAKAPSRGTQPGRQNRVRTGQGTFRHQTNGKTQSRAIRRDGRRPAFPDQEASDGGNVCRHPITVIVNWSAGLRK